MEGDGGLAAAIPARLSAAEGRKFGLVVGGAFLTVAGLLWWRGHPAGALAAGGVGTALGLAGLLLPGRLGPVHAAWMGLAALLSTVTTPVFMGMVYFVVVTPVGLLRRLLGRNPLARSRQAASFWIAKDPAPGRRSDLQHQF